MPSPVVSPVAGTQYNQVTTQNRNPQQMQGIQELLSSILPHLNKGVGNLGELASGGSPEMWQQLEAPAMRQFGQLQGSLASRFSGMGSGARKSSGFQNTIGAAGTDLAERLQSNRLGLQNQALQQLMGLGTNLLGQDLQDTQFLPKQKPWYQEFLTSIAPGLAQSGTQFSGMAALFKMFPQLASQLKAGEP